MAARVWREFMNAAATRTLREFLDEWQRRTYPVAGNVRIGNSSTEIVREAGEWKADLLVLGTQRRWTGSSTQLGSTEGVVLCRLSCNALVIPVSHWVSRHGDVHGLFSNAEAACLPGTEEYPENGVVFVAG
jgi:hypothetical protein